MSNRDEVTLSKATLAILIEAAAYGVTSLPHAAIGTSIRDDRDRLAPNWQCAIKSAEFASAPAAPPVELLEIHPGMRVISTRGESDTGDNGEERHTGRAAVGWVERLNHTDTGRGAHGMRHWDVCFLQGTTVILSTAELSDRGAYRVSEPETLRDQLLAYEWLTGEGERTAYDDDVIALSIDILEHAPGIINLIDARRAALG